MQVRTAAAAAVAIGAAYVGLRWQIRVNRRMKPVDADAIVAAELSRLTGAGWVARYVRYGILAGVVVGVPIGAILAFGLEAADLPNGSRMLMAVIFVGVSICWTIPGAFAMRWAVLRNFKNYRKIAPHISG